MRAHRALLGTRAVRQLHRRPLAAALSARGPASWRRWEASGAPVRHGCVRCHLRGGWDGGVRLGSRAGIEGWRAGVGVEAGIGVGGLGLRVWVRAVLGAWGAHGEAEVLVAAQASTNLSDARLKLVQPEPLRPRLPSRRIGRTATRRCGRVRCRPPTSLRGRSRAPLLPGVQKAISAGRHGVRGRLWSASGDRHRARCRCACRAVSQTRARHSAEAAVRHSPLSLRPLCARRRANPTTPSPLPMLGIGMRCCWRCAPSASSSMEWPELGRRLPGIGKVISW